MKTFGLVLSQIGKAVQAADAVKKLEDSLLDKIEEFIQETDNTIDDAIVLPVVKGLRKIAEIPDNDEVENA